MATTETAIVAASVAQRPGHGGHAWVFLQYLLGFRELGWDVHFVDRLTPEMCVDREGHPAPFRESENLRYLSELMEGFGLGENWTLIYDGDEGRDVAGRPHAEAVEAARRSALLINVMGYLDDEGILAAAPLRVFLGIDPGFAQIWHDLGLSRPFDGHDRHITVGSRIGAPDCAIPTCGIDWITTLPPVELSEWPVAPGDPQRFTSVASWRGPYGPLEYRGRTYGLRVHEFRRFFELPRRTSARFEVALDIDEAEAPDLQALAENDWKLIDPRAVAGTAAAYRDYVNGSGAELMIAKNIYVDTRSGWFSDRSACYLAAGKPVLAQDTALAGVLPLGEGLVTFSDLDEAVAGAEEISGNYDRHARAARALAEEHFAAARVLPDLLGALGIA